MNIKLLFTGLLSLAYINTYAQSKKELSTFFKEQNEVKTNKFKQRLSKSHSNHSFNISNLAEITDYSAVFYQTDDYRANNASNIDYLQSGQVGGFALNGDNMDIAIFDGGATFAPHKEFGDKSSTGLTRVSDLENKVLAMSTHATSVAGFIAAGGYYNVTFTYTDGSKVTFNQAAKGVLPNAKIKSAGFSTTTNGNIFSKILNYNYYISNHSYGVNYGWSYDANGSLGKGWYYPVNTTIFTKSSDTFFGTYLTNDENYDKIVYADPKFTIIKSAGNYYGDGPAANDTIPKYRWGNGAYQAFDGKDIMPDINCKSGAYCIGTGSLAKNIIVVGAVNVPNTSNNRITSKNEIIRSSYSSVGPRKDGAIKPDLVAVGTNVIAPTAIATDSTSVTRFTMGSGTSYSAPKVTGAIGAITQLKRLLSGDNQYYFYADEIKALLLHTTMEAGDFEGPDNWFGWGMLDAKKAAETLVDIHNKTGSILERNDKKSGVDYNKEIIATSNTDNELKVTLTWIDPAGTPATTNDGAINDKTSKIVNDFDLRVIDTQTNEVFMPWKLDLSNPTGAAIKGDNLVDNVEQISIKSPVVGRKYKIVVSNKGTLVNENKVASDQKYTLLITGGNPANLDTSELDKLNSISVYPTVTKDIVNVQTTEKITVVDIFDMTGKKVSSSDKKQINISNLPTGVYIINIKTDKQSVSKKIVKQ